MHFVNLYYTEKVVDLTLTPDKAFFLGQLPGKLQAMKLKVENYTIADGKVRLTLKLRQKDYLNTIQKLLGSLDGMFTIDEMN